MTAETYALGFYVYGAIGYALVGAAAIAWHDPLALAMLLVGALLTALGYMMEATKAPHEARAADQAMAVAAIFGWFLPIAAAVKVIL